MARRYEDQKTSKQVKLVRCDTRVRQTRSLGFSTVEDYAAWCRRLGLKTSVEKSIHQLHHERNLRNNEKNLEVLQKRKNHAPTSELERIRLIFRDERQVFSGGAFSTLLASVERCRKILSPTTVVPSLEEGLANTHVGGLAALATTHSRWIRDPADWRPKSHNADRVFGSLARHLLVRYDIPQMMDAVWFFGNGDEAVRQQGWYVHMGKGGNIRTADVPIELTKKMSHAFLRAPKDLLPTDALRWGQIHAFGGNERLVRAILATSLRGHFEDDDFWKTVFRFFVDNPLLDVQHVGPIIDFVHERKFATRRVFVRPGVLENLPPLQPNFSMKGRCANALLRQVAHWHHGLAKVSGRGCAWEASGFPGFERVETDRKTQASQIWLVRELLSSKELSLEGRALRHCVAIYASSCASGRCSIWSVRVDDGSGERPLVTVEVDRRTRRVIQARGKLNAPPTSRAAHVMKLWAVRARLKFASGILR